MQLHVAAATSKACRPFCVLQGRYSVQRSEIVGARKRKGDRILIQCGVLLRHFAVVEELFFSTDE